MTTLVTEELGTICDRAGGIIQTGPFGSQLHESDYSDDGTPVVMPKDIVEGRVSDQSIARISQEHVDRLARHKLTPGDIVYGRRGDIGRRALTTPRESGWLCGTGCLRISPGNAIIDPVFLYYYLGHPDVIGWIANQAIGATLPNLNTGILRSVAITYPPLPIQRKIAAILSAYDDLIENNTRRIALLEEMARALYREWFVEFRFPGHEEARTVESSLGLIPAGWEVEKLSAVASYINRGVSPKYDESAPGLVLNQKCIREGRISLSPARHHATKGPEPKRVRFGDVVVNSTGIGTLGRVAQVYENIPDCTVDSHVTIVRPSPACDIDYFGMSLMRMERYFDGAGTGTTGQTELSRVSIGNAALLMPPLNLQQDFGAAVSPIRSLMVRLATRNNNLRQTRDLLLSKLVSGEVDVEGLEIAGVVGEDAV